MFYGVFLYCSLWTTFHKHHTNDLMKLSALQTSLLTHVSWCDSNSLLTWSLLWSQVFLFEQKFSCFFSQLAVLPHPIPSYLSVPSIKTYKKTKSPPVGAFSCHRGSGRPRTSQPGVLEWRQRQAEDTRAGYGRRGKTDHSRHSHSQAGKQTQTYRMCHCWK